MPASLLSGRLAAPRVVVTGAALADGTRESLQHDVSLLVEGDTIAGLWADGAAPDPDPDVRVVDGAGSTIVPGLVDSHAHITMPGGAHWIERGLDPTAELDDVAEENGEAMVAAGIRWARDCGSPRRAGRAVSLALRDRWRERTDRPHIRAAGTWLTRTGSLPEGLAVEIDHGADLTDAVTTQLDDGADLVKLYLDGPDTDTSPFSLAEVSAAVSIAHERGARVAAHASQAAGTAVGARAGVDTIEHGFGIDTDTAAVMAGNGVRLVATLAILSSFSGFLTTTTMSSFSGDAAARYVSDLGERAYAGVAAAYRAGVQIAAGSDAGGGSLRAGHLAWEVQCLVAAGLPPHEALAAATWRGGDLFGDPSAGRLAVGGPAHFSLLHGDPLTDPSALWRVWLTR